MSQQLISHSPDLKQLVDDGFEVEIVAGHLVIHNIPYVDGQGKVKRGKLVSVLDLSGDRTVQPNTHVALFVGDHPCDRHGKKLPQLDHSVSRQQIAEGVIIERSFSCKPKPKDKYDDYHHKMTTYAAMISVHAEQVDPNVTAQTFRVIENSDADSPFNYIDNATSRVGINVHARKLELARVGIAGLGGTGSYVLDFLAKTPVREIHLYDGDWFLQHNAFRAPGAATLEELRERLRKVHYFQRRYEPMHRGIIPHPVYLDASNVDELEAFDFVFLCMDGNPAEKIIVQKLEEFGIPFIDTGMGIENSDDGLRGILRVTTSTPEQRGHVWENGRIPFTDGKLDDEYSSNIQVADLNAFNAVQAVIRFKKYFGFYADLEGEHFTTYTLDGNHVTNEEE
ncbi:ThiF family adenylyltransferase [Haliea alexandrii]|uniref:ThiF family adenylyltransferase n=1 Tax=Haliea alexandrii TaxID=2448162 RepID=UPI000F0B39BB|nr:ThiF family adenylyltransferase [Haliea alexandrii]|tara:strand:+ start:3478 stop:4662 length:1185 start_codon:yes stop_codon:yes gene_type:complete